MSVRKVFATLARESRTGKAVTAVLALAAMAGTFAACAALDDTGSSEAEFRSVDNGPPKKMMPYFNR